MGLPNIGASCWLNSILQIFIHCSRIRAIMMEAGKSKGPLHNLIISLYEALETRTPHEILPAYRELHDWIVQANPIFGQSAMNDANEVLTFIINRLHEEAAVHIPDYVSKNVSDSASHVILRDFDNRISRMLELCLCVIARQASDLSTIYETYTTVFLDPKTPLGYNMQEALNKYAFANVPINLFLNIVMGNNYVVQVPESLTIQNIKFILGAIIFYDPMKRHYMTGIKGMTEQQQPIWCIFNDAYHTFANTSQLAAFGQPCLLMYEHA